MTEITIITCRYCAKQPSGLDGLCPVCRTQLACDNLTQQLSDALENFLDDRWFPHRFGMRPAYYLDAAAFDDPSVYDDVTAAYGQVVQGVQRLIELAVGQPVEVFSELRFDPGSGFHAAVEWLFKEGDR